MTPDLDSLRSRFPVSGVTIDHDAHGMPRIDVSTPGAAAHAYLHGAHVTHYQPHGSAPVLFMSAESAFAPDKPIRGGVPVIFPWFGPRPTRPDFPAHGFARTREWSLRDIRRDGNVVTVEFGLTSDGFELRYTVTVADALEMALEVRNASAGAARFEEALHTYLAVSDVRQVRVEGLTGRQYVDKVDGMKRKTQSGPITITGETDRVYLDTPDAVTVEDEAGGRKIVVSKEGSASTVVWNPWVEKAKRMPDFGDDEWPSMLCVETANVADNAITLPPAGTHVMRAVVRVE